MNDQDVITYIIQTREDIASIKAMLEPLVPRVESHEVRLGTVESDVKIYKRVFLSLWGLIVVVGTWAIGFFK